MNWIKTEQRRAMTRPARKRNRRVERLNRQIRELHSTIRVCQESLRAPLDDDLGNERPDQSLTDSQRATPVDPGSVLTQPTGQLHITEAQFAELFAQIRMLDDGFSRCAQNTIDVLEAIAVRLEALVTPARYRR